MDAESNVNLFAARIRVRSANNTCVRPLPLPVLAICQALLLPNSMSCDMSNYNYVLI